MPILTPEERIGSLVGGRYRVERVLATGGMGILFEGNDIQQACPVAIKFLKPHDNIDAWRKRRFLQEIRTTARLRHPHVVEVRDAGEDRDGVPYLVMELLSGRSLQQELRSAGRMSVANALHTLLPIFAALARAHAVGVIHRDIKPDNIFLGRDQDSVLVPKLLDFGVAKVYESSLDTRSGAMLGTAEYMAPEQAGGAEVGPGTDIWALGVVIYRCLSGTTPFAAQTPAKVVARVVSDTPDPLELEPGLKVFCAVVERALRHEPAARYPDVRSFARALVGGARLCGIAVELDSPAVAELIGDQPISIDASATTFDRSRPARRASAGVDARSQGRRVGVALVLLLAVASSLWVAGSGSDLSLTPRGAVRTEATDAPAAATPASELEPAPPSPAPDAVDAVTADDAPRAVAKPAPAAIPAASSADAEPATSLQSASAARRARVDRGEAEARSARPRRPPAPAAASAHRADDALEFETEW